jgi:hypothetical protein
MTDILTYTIKYLQLYGILTNSVNMCSNVWYTT